MRPQCNPHPAGKRVHTLRKALRRATAQDAAGPTALPLDTQRQESLLPSAGLAGARTVGPGTRSLHQIQQGNHPFHPLLRLSALKVPLHAERPCPLRRRGTRRTGKSPRPLHGTAAPERIPAARHHVRQNTVRQKRQPLPLLTARHQPPLHRADNQH